MGLLIPGTDKATGFFEEKIKLRIIVSK